MSATPGTVRPSPVRLTEWASVDGTSGKWEQASLAELVAGLDPTGPADLLVGLDPSDDAAVLRLTDDLALVSTTDFCSPVVDDPTDFGAIVAANACSDVYAMGGRVVLALNLAAFPVRLPPAALTAIVSGAAEVVREAGAVIAGGHTIRSDELVFGLAVQGVVHPDGVLTCGGARPGDVLVLSKPIGTGVVLADGSDDEKARVIDGMKMLNRLASERLLDLGPACHAVTDVSGFGLLGHVQEMAERSGACLVVDSEMVPCYRGAKQLAADGRWSAGADRNQRSLGGLVSVADGVPEAMRLLAHDPQISGGLLAAVEPDEVAALVDAGFRPIGTVRDVDADDDGYATEPMTQLL